MGRTEINVTSVINANGEIISAKNSAASAKNSFSQVSSGIDGKIKNRANIRSRINSINSQLANIETRITRIHNTVNQSVNRYVETDNSVAAMKGNLRNVSAFNKAEPNRWARYFDSISSRSSVVGVRNNLIINSNGNLIVDKAKFKEYVDKDLADLTKEELIVLSGIEAAGYGEKLFGTNYVRRFGSKLSEEDEMTMLAVNEIEETLKLESGGDFDKINKWAEKKKENLEEKLKDKDLYDEDKETVYYDKDGKVMKDSDAPDFKERKLTFGEINHESKASVSVLDKTYENWLGGNLNVVVAEAEAHASFAAGAYLIGNDGTKVFSPGVSAELGASATVFNADYGAQVLGNEMIGLNVDAEVTALQAETIVEGEINFLDKNDKGNIVFDPSINVGAKAEAVLAEVEGSVGLNILGGEAAIKGSAKVGVGANFDMGLQDGVVKCEIGVAVGLGVDVGFEVDVGGMINTVVDGASSAWDSLTGWAEDAGNWIFGSNNGGGSW